MQGQKALSNLWLAISVLLICFFCSCVGTMGGVEEESSEVETVSDFNPDLDLGEGFVSLPEEEKGISFTPPEGWILGYENPDNTGCVWVSSDETSVNVQGLHVSVLDNPVEEYGSLEDVFYALSFRPEQREEAQNGNWPVESLEVIDDFSSGPVLRATRYDLGDGFITEYLWIVEGKVLLLYFTGLPSDREQLELLAEVTAESVEIEEGGVQ